jgi:hypothetical protein
MDRRQAPTTSTLAHVGVGAILIPALALHINPAIRPVPATPIPSARTISTPPSADAVEPRAWLRSRYCGAAAGRKVVIARGFFVGHGLDEVALFWSRQ